MGKLTFYEKQRAKGHAEADGVINGTTIGFRVWSSNGTTDEENDFGRRLVASYEACKTLSTESLETGTVKELMGEIMAQNARLQAQNEQMLEALEKINGCQADGIALDDPGGWMDFFIETARRAIAAATITEKTETP